MSNDHLNHDRLQFRLRTLLLAVLVLSVVMSWLAVHINRARRQRAAVKHIEQLGGWTDDWPSLWELLLGRDAAPVVQASLNDTSADDNALGHVCNLYYLADLDLCGTKVTDAGLQRLASLRYLEHVCLEDTLVTPEGIRSFQEAKPRCRIDY